MSSNKPGILFVDDEPQILHGLRRSLRSMADEWSMSFVESGPKAIELFKEQTFNVVVSDMRMPGMNGAELLAEIKKKHPQTVRLILSGHADRELILQCVGTAHQFLSKPCEPESLRDAIRRGVRFDASLKSERIKTLVAQMESIPSIPAIYSEIIEKLRDEEATVDELGELIAKDLAITAKLLKLVNSAFFGIQRPVTTPADAAAYLGFDTIKALVLGVNAFMSFQGREIPGLTLEALWTHCMQVGNAARIIARTEGLNRVQAEESFLAGMLHDLGKLMFAVNLPKEYERAFEMTQCSGIPLHEAEQAVFGVNHADVAGYLLSLWGLPVRVVDAIGLHHEAMKTEFKGMDCTLAVQAANQIVHSSSIESIETRSQSDHSTIFHPEVIEKFPAWKEQIALC